jgi:hypothetical protein
MALVFGPCDFVHYLDRHVCQISQINEVVSLTISRHSCYGCSVGNEYKEEFILRRRFSPRRFCSFTSRMGDNCGCGKTDWGFDLNRFGILWSADHF